MKQIILYTSTHVVAINLTIWLILLRFHSLSFLEWLFLFAPLIIVPLGLTLLDNGRPPTQLTLLATLLLTLAFLLPKGVTAVLLTLPYLYTSLFIARRQLKKQHRQLPDFAETASTLFLIVGGFWATWSQLGGSVIGFSEVIVLLTAVHFHYAGFATALIAAQIGRHRHTNPTLYTPALIGTLSGIPLVAIGISTTPLLELLGTLILAASLVTLAIMQLTAVLSFAPLSLLPRTPAHLLLTVSAIAILIGMFLALLYAISQVTHTVLIPIPHMIRTHGLLNAFGFVFCGLWGWHLSR